MRPRPLSTGAGAPSPSWSLPPSGSHPPAHLHPLAKRPNDPPAFWGVPAVTHHSLLLQEAQPLWPRKGQTVGDGRRGRQRETNPSLAFSFPPPRSLFRPPQRHRARYSRAGVPRKRAGKPRAEEAPRDAGLGVASSLQERGAMAASAYRKNSGAAHLLLRVTCGCGSWRWPPGSARGTSTGPPRSRPGGRGAPSGGPAGCSWGRRAARGGGRCGPSARWARGRP